MGQYLLTLDAARQADLATLQTQLQATFSLPDLYVNGSPSTNQIQVNTPSRDLTAQEQTTLASIVAAYDGGPRRPRNMLDIVTDLAALTPAQQTAVWNDITSGNPPKWATNLGADQGARSAHQLLATVLTGGAQNQARLRMVALYLRDNPRYLMAPAFDPAVSVRGDEPAPAAQPVPSGPRVPPGRPDNPGPPAR